MKKIEWHKVTWYSKTLSVFLTLYIFCFGFYLGTDYGVFTVNHPEFDSGYFTLDKKTNTVGVNVNTDIWSTYKNDTYGLSFKYPKEWRVKNEYIANKDTPEEEGKIVLGPASGKSYFEIEIKKWDTNYNDTAFDPASAGADKRGIIGGILTSFDGPMKMYDNNIEIPHSYLQLAELVKGNYLYSFKLASMGINDDMTAGDYAVMRGILITFRFTGKHFLPEAFTSPKDYSSLSKKNLLHIVWDPSKIDASTIYLRRQFADPGEKAYSSIQIYKRNDISDPVSKTGKFDYVFNDGGFSIPIGMYSVEIYSYGERDKLISGEFLLTY